MIKKEALQFLQANHVAAVATAHKILPYISVVYYVADDDFNLYFSTRKDTDKHLNLSTNSNVAVAVGLGPKHIALQARGHATLLGGEARERALHSLQQMLHKKKITNWPTLSLEKFQPTNGGMTTDVVYRVTPQHLSFFNLNDQTYPQSLSNKSHQILP